MFNGISAGMNKVIKYGMLKSVQLNVLIVGVMTPCTTGTYVHYSITTFFAFSFSSLIWKNKVSAASIISDTEL